MTDVNERTWFKGVNLLQVLWKKYTSIEFRPRTVEELIDELKANAEQLIARAYRKIFSGIGMTFLFTDRDIAVKEKRRFSMSCISHTGVGLHTNLFLRQRRSWDMIVHEYNPLMPLIFSPFNHTQNYLENHPDHSRVCKEAILHWPTCPLCKEKFFWRYVRTSTPEEKYEFFSDRDLFCCNNTCSRFGKHTGMKITDIILPDKADTKLFVSSFVALQKKRSKDLRTNRDSLPMPRPMLIALQREGFQFMKSMKGRYADTANEKNYAPYNDLANEDLEEKNPYPNG
jgi:hypothetical protein